MMTGLSLSFVDGQNLELLFNNLLSDSHIVKSYVKVLSLDSIVFELVSGHPEYEGIEVTKDLSSVLSKIVDKRDVNEETSDTIVQRVLSDTGDYGSDEASIEMRFVSDSVKDDNSENGENDSASEDSGTTIRVAVVDDDQIVRALLQKSFQAIGAKAELFTSGKEFISRATASIIGTATEFPHCWRSLP